MNIVKRLQQFTMADFVCSYSAKLFVGLGIGLLLPEVWRPFGWLFILLAILIGFRAELKFWQSRE